MRFKNLLITGLIVGGIGLVGCTQSEKIKDVPVSDIQSAIKTAKVLKLENPIETSAKEHWILETVKDKIEDGFVSQAQINVKLQDVIVVKTQEPELITQAIEDYKTNSLRMFADGYGGDENAQAVANSILNTKGNYVYFIATQNATEVEAEILKQIVE